MNTAVILIIIIFVVIIVLTGVGVGIYFLTRDNNNNPSPPFSEVPYPNLQQGGKIVPIGFTGNARVGFSVAVSEDGNTLVMGAPQDNSGVGAIWIYNRSAGIWSPQSIKLVPSDPNGASEFGYSVEINTDGSGIIVGGPGDDANKGAFWVFTRISNAWSQVGNKVTSSTASPGSRFGCSVDVSDTDFAYAAIGGIGDNSNIGATWIFLRNGDTWSEQAKLVASDRVGASSQGYSVRITDGGEAVAVGAPGDNSNLGCFWVFTRNGTLWAQAGGKIVPTGYVGQARIGSSLAISGSEGNTLAVGAPGDNGNVGAVWMFTREGNNLVQQGGKLVSSGYTGQSLQGSQVRLSNIGRTCLIGAYGDNNNQGIAFTWTRNDLLNWEQLSHIRGTGNSGEAQQGYGLGLSADGTTGILGAPSDNGGIGAVWVFIYSI